MPDILPTSDGRLGTMLEAFFGEPTFYSRPLHTAYGQNSLACPAILLCIKIAWQSRVHVSVAGYSHAYYSSPQNEVPTT